MKKAQRPEEFKGRSIHIERRKQNERPKGVAEFESQLNTREKRVKGVAMRRS